MISISNEMRDSARRSVAVLHAFEAARRKATHAFGSARYRLLGFAFRDLLGHRVSGVRLSCRAHTIDGNRAVDIEAVGLVAAL